MDFLSMRMNLYKLNFTKYLLGIFEVKLKEGNLAKNRGQGEQQHSGTF